ncbi:MAG: Asp-tRNA(Asn)/Glu-tRNA(Gln) amidotransferase subunit GatC [bacterium]
MSIDKRMIDHLETLARIEFTPSEKRLFTLQLERIVGYIKQLHQVDTETAAPAGPAHPREAEAAALDAEATPLRPDDPGTCLDRDAVLDEAPESKDHLFRVPRIIER